jgi:hypothetical protein
VKVNATRCPRSRLIDERTVGYDLAFLEQIRGRNLGTARRRVDWSAARFRHGREVGIHLFDDESRGDEVARLGSLQHRGVLHLVRHGHRRHEAFDVLVLHQDFLLGRIDAENLSPHFVTARLRGAAARRGGHEQDQDRDSAGTAHVLNSTK